MINQVLINGYELSVVDKALNELLSADKRKKKLSYLEIRSIEKILFDIKTVLKDDD